MFEDLLRAWDGEEAVIHFDRESGAWIFVCVHSTALGPAGGGTRMRVYDAPADGLADAMRLSQMMTVKMAVANADRGGGKAVLAVPELPSGDARRKLLLRYAELVNSLGGTYRTAGDMNISPSDLDIVAERTEWVYGTTGRGGNSGRGTARGVLHGIRASVEHVFGAPDLKGRSVLVQGVGAVGSDLARLLAGDGADLRCARLLRGHARPHAKVDIFAPCALGAVLNDTSIPKLRCDIVAGAANNQLADDARDGTLLEERGILYAPDFVINAGGVLQLLGLEEHGWSEDELERNLAAIGDTLRQLYRDADANGITPTAAAEQLAAERVAAAKS